MGISDTQPMEVRPRCCANGDEYITIHAADIMQGPDQTGWAIPLARPHGEAIIENVKWCPFCGKKLQ